MPLAKKIISSKKSRQTWATKSGILIKRRPPGTKIQEEWSNEFFKITAPNGCLCIADLDPDNGQFHGDNDTVFHSGFDRAALRQVLEGAGFIDIRDRTAATVMKPDPDGALRPFGVFLMIARKRPWAAGCILGEPSQSMVLLPFLLCSW
jgi:hypothetical protein